MKHKVDKLVGGFLGSRRNKHETAVAAQPPGPAELPGDAPIDPQLVETAELGPLAKLPPFRPVILTLLRLFDQPEVTLGEVTRLVESDPAVVAEFLGVVNSPLFGMQGTVATAAHALSLLGLERTRGLVSALAMRALMANAPRTPVIRRFWTHSVATATAAQHLAPVFGVGKDIAYVAGIMHDLGRMGLVAAHSEPYTELALASHDSIEAILAAEQTACGRNHCATGLLLARAWGLPRVLHPAIGNHHAAPSGGSGLEALTQISCRLADSLQFQAIHHRDVLKPAKTIEAAAPAGIQAAIAAELDTIQAHVLDTIQALDY